MSRGYWLLCTGGKHRKAGFRKPKRGEKNQTKGEKKPKAQEGNGKRAEKLAPVRHFENFPNFVITKYNFN